MLVRKLFWLIALSAILVSTSFTAQARPSNIKPRPIEKVNAPLTKQQAKQAYKSARKKAKANRKIQLKELKNIGGLYRTADNRLAKLENRKSSSNGYATISIPNNAEKRREIENARQEVNNLVDRYLKQRDIYRTAKREHAAIKKQSWKKFGSRDLTAGTSAVSLTIQQTGSDIASRRTSASENVVRPTPSSSSINAGTSNNAYTTTYGAYVPPSTARSYTVSPKGEVERDLKKRNRR